MENENEQVEEMKARRAPQMEMMKNSLTLSKCEGPLQSGGPTVPGTLQAELLDLL